MNAPARKIKSVHPAMDPATRMPSPDDEPKGGFLDPDRLPQGTPRPEIKNGMTRHQIHAACLAAMVAGGVDVTAYV